MKSTESKVSKTSSALQSKSKGAFFAKKKNEAFGPEKTSSSPIQTKSPSTPFFTNSGNALQSKLEVHPSDDVYEKEADSMADRVTQKTSSGSADPPTQPNDINQATPLSNSISRLQRQRAFESPTALEQNTANLAPSDEMPLQREATEQGSGGHAPDGMDAALSSAKGQGSPLPDSTKSKK
jgi:hypothetical protein